MPGTITVRPIQAKLGTSSGQNVQRLDPFCVAIVGNHHAESKVCRKGGLNPKWEDSLSLSRNQESYCYVEVKDKTLLKDKMLGVCAIDLDVLPGQESQQKWYDLYYQQKPVGEILLETVYTPEGSERSSGSEKLLIKEDFMMPSESLGGRASEILTTTPTNRGFERTSYQSAVYESAGRSSYDLGGVNYGYESGSFLERTPETRETETPLRAGMTNLQLELRDMSQRVDEMLSKAKGMDYSVGRDYSSPSIVIQSTQLVSSSERAAEEGLPHVPNDSGVNASHQEFIEERSHLSTKDKFKETVHRAKEAIKEGIDSLRHKNHEEEETWRPQRGRSPAKDKAKELKQKIVTGMDHIKEMAHEKKEEFKEKYTHSERKVSKEREDEVQYGESPKKRSGSKGGMKVKILEGVEKLAHKSVKKLESLEERAREKREVAEETEHEPGKFEVFKEKLVEELMLKLERHRPLFKHSVDEGTQTEITFEPNEVVTKKSFKQKGGLSGLKEKIVEGVENFKESHFGTEEVETKKSSKQSSHQKGGLSGLKEKIVEGVEHIKESIEESKTSSHKQSHGHGHKKHHHHHESHKKKKESKPLDEGVAKLKAVAEAILSQLHHKDDESSSHSSASESSSSRSASREKTKKSKKHHGKKKEKQGVVKDVLVQGAKHGVEAAAKRRAKDKVEDVKEKVFGGTDGSADDERVEYDTTEHVKESSSSHKEQHQNTKESSHVEKEQQKDIKESSSVEKEEEHQDFKESLVNKGQDIKETLTHTGQEIKEKIEVGVAIVKEKLGLNHQKETEIVQEDVIMMNPEENEKMIEQYIEHDSPPHTFKEKVIHGFEKVKEILESGKKSNRGAEELFSIEEAGESQACNVDWFKNKARGEESQPIKILVTAPKESESTKLSFDEIKIETEEIEGQFLRASLGQHQIQREISPGTLGQIEAAGVEKVKDFYMIQEENEKDTLRTKDLAMSSSNLRDSGSYIMERPSVEHRRGTDVYHIPILTNLHQSAFSSSGGELYEEMKRRYLGSEPIAESHYTEPVLSDLSQRVVTAPPESLFTEALNELTGVGFDLYEMKEKQEILEREPVETMTVGNFYDIEQRRRQLAADASDLLGTEEYQAAREEEPVEIVTIEKRIYEVPMDENLLDQGEAPVQGVIIEEVITEIPIQGQKEFVVDLDKDVGGVAIVEGLTGIDKDEAEGFVVVEEIIVEKVPEEEILLEKAIVEEVLRAEENLFKDFEDENQGEELEVEIEIDGVRVQDRDIQEDHQQMVDLMNLENLENRGIARDDLNKEKVEIQEDVENAENEDPNMFKKIFDRVAQ